METWNNIRGMIKKDFPYLVCILILLFLLLLVVSNQQEEVNQCNEHWAKEFKEKCTNNWDINYEDFEYDWEKEETETTKIQTSGES